MSALGNSLRIAGNSSSLKKRNNMVRFLTFDMTDRKNYTG